MTQFIVKQFSIFFILLALSKAASGASDRVILDEAGVRNIGIQTVEAEEREFEVSVFAIGRIEEIPEKRSVLSSRIPGRVVSLEAFVGDFVSEGQVLAKVESRQLGNPPPTIELRAPQPGLVIESHVRLGQPVEPDNELLDISDRTQLWAVAKIPEKAAAQVDAGTLARIRVPALGERQVQARLLRFGVDADRRAGAVEGIFVIENTDGKLRPGMRAEFSIVLDTRRGVMAIPREAVQGDPASRVVFVRDFDLPNAFLRVPVVLGTRNDSFVEVVSGLLPGDEVVTRGSYSLAFAGSGSGISLKEALDAAHGHEHNEDGSEMTPAQRAARQSLGTSPDDASRKTLERGLRHYAIAVSAAFVFLLQLQIRNRRKAKG